MAQLERIGWNHFFIRRVPTHHLACSPAFVGHVHGNDARHPKFDRAVKRFAIAKMVVKVGMVKVLVLATRLGMFRQYLKILVTGDPTGRREFQSPTVPANQMVDANAIAHRP